VRAALAVGVPLLGACGSESTVATGGGDEGTEVEEVDAGSVTGLVRTPDGFLAYGSPDSDTHAFWRSPDGRAWTEVVPDGLPVDGEEADGLDLEEQTAIDELAVTPEGVVAAETPEEGDGLIVWRFPPG